MKSFDDLYLEKKDYVMRVAFNWFKSEARAEEASQEFFFWLARNLHTFDPAKGTFKKWFTAHLVFKFQVYKHHLSKKGRGGNREIEIAPIHLNSLVCHNTQNNIDRAITRASLLKAMDRLSDAQKRVMLLMLNTDYSQTEIGNELGISWNGVKFQQYKSYPMMKKALLKEEVA